MTTWTPLAQFLDERSVRTSAPAWQHPLTRSSSRASLRLGIEELVDTVTALQRAEWLEDGVYLGPRSYGDVWEDLRSCAARLGTAVPPAIISPIPARRQRILGTDARPYLHLSSFFFARAPQAQRRFLLGRLLGPVADGGVTADSVYALLVDEGGLRTLARRTLGPTLEVGLAPAAFAARLVLSRSHRVAEVNADRSGFVCAGDAQESARALLRIALGVNPRVDPDAYLDQLDQLRPRSPGRWAEAWASAPWTHKRIRAISLFAHSQAGSRALGHPPEDDALSDAALDAAIDALLEVGPWNAS